MEELRRGPWTVEEDLLLVKHVAEHGEGRWNALARCAGLKRTGKSCRLRWLNYLRPDVRRGNITPEEQLLILDLHSRWGNRWSKIAQHLPGRTDNEIKNYWRTRVQKHAKQLRCDVNSKMFRDAMRYVWMPRLLERIRATSGGAAAPSATSPAAAAVADHPLPPFPLGQPEQQAMPYPERAGSSSTSASSEDSLPAPSQFSSSFANCYWTSMQGGEAKVNGSEIHGGHGGVGWTTEQYSSLITIPMSTYDERGLWDGEQGGWPSGDWWSNDHLWSLEDTRSMQQ